ncbi:SAM-dependent methyltransferase [Streptomyces sp. NPDC048514]|uniref:SAM-dependent methyltransferase n=1 Tax=Streptomyces sp. NPDC048514 TaxID=3365564 RepID=UPI003719AAC7
MIEARPATAGPAEQNTSVAHGARVRSHRTGGKDDHESRRRAGERVAGMFPVIRAVARADREFPARAVALPAGERGIRRFPDFGNASATPPITARGREESAAFLDGLDPLEPGLVPSSRWLAESAAAVPRFGAVAVKP